ncbi:hypothetical protein [Sphingomonas sp. dw_22]|uniref:hypothetical protein n=1 Tax=Sphingomonas sp. dw_22 TaxID=2721175 RepID=UPI001BD3255D|nr:hypothetical protein [Sphingomonas sp. dw_22]
MAYKSLPLTALVAALALAGCNKTPETTDNALVNVAGAEDLDDVPDNDEAPVIEDVGAETTEAVAIPAVPKPVAGTPAAEAAPLADAGEIEQEIRTGTGIQRVRYGDGWAWTQSGRIVRTADRDGKNIAYFRRGEDKPFFVQRGDRSFAYQGDKPVREFDHDGRGRAPEADHAKEAADAAREARTRHDQAEQAREHARPDSDRGRPERPHASPTPTPSPTATGRGRDDHRDRPSPRPSDQPRRDRDGDKDRDRN